jgi:fumarate hydratase subunit alpha
MRVIHIKKIVEAVKKACVSANTDINPDVSRALKKSLLKEKSPVGREIIRQILENHDIAGKEHSAICQDTGVAVVFVKLGQDVRIAGGKLSDAVNEGVRKGYKEGYLRASMVNDPFERKNTGDNTPAIIHTEITAGDRLKITVAAKGGGSENMSTVRMFPPSAEAKDIRDFVVYWAGKAGANPCPPVVVGIGIGGNFEMSAKLAKKSLLRDINSSNKNPFYANLEKAILNDINRLGIGPQGLGGTVTALAVHIEAMPCHIASLPVAINIDCHVTRHKTVIL